MYAFLMRLLFFLSLFWYLDACSKSFGEYAPRGHPNAAGPRGQASGTVIPFGGVSDLVWLYVLRSRGVFHFFCSEKCRDQFMNNPDSLDREESRSGSEFADSYDFQSSRH
jgi:hypothetical protein